MDMTFKQGGKTGYPVGLLQDDDSGLSKWFASRPDARYIVRKNIQERTNENLQGMGKTNYVPLRPDQGRG
jgi:hypothetical protein